MSSRRDAAVHDRLWPLVARALVEDDIWGIDVVWPAVLPGTRVDFADRQAARIIRAREYDLAMAGVIIAEDN